MQAKHIRKAAFRRSRDNSSRKVKPKLAKEYLGTGEDEGEVIVEVRKVRVALKVLPNLSLIGGRRMRNLLLEEAADLLEPLLLRLPRWSRRRRCHRHRNPPPANWVQSQRERERFLEYLWAQQREKENDTAFKRNATASTRFALEHTRKTIQITFCSASKETTLSHFPHCSQPQLSNTEHCSLARVPFPLG